MTGASGENEDEEFVENNLWRKQDGGAWDVNKVFSSLAFV